MVYCDRCGVEASFHDRYCRMCGREVRPDWERPGLIFCDQCGVEADSHDTYCRACGRSLNRPSMLWFEVSTVPRPASTPLILKETVPAVPPRSSEVVSAIVPPVAVTVGPKSARLRLPEPSASQARTTAEDSRVTELSLVENNDYKRGVLEKQFITNRKSPSKSELETTEKSEDTLTKAITKPPIAPSKPPETKSELGPVGFTREAESVEETQAGTHAQISKSDLGPTSLIPKLEALEKTQASVDAHISKHRSRSSSALIGYGLTGVGAVSLVLAVVFTSTVLAFIGLGLAFWGALLLFIRPRHYVRSDLMDSTALSSLTSIDRVITSLGYTQKGIYLPAENPEKTVVFIPAQHLGRMPKIEQVEKQVFVKDPEGITLVPPGLSLANFFERQLGVKFSNWSLREMSERLPKLLIEDLEMVQDCAISVDGDNVSFKFIESVYAEFCSKLRDSTKVCASLGCPMCSAMACVLAQVSHRPVEFDKDKYSTDGRTVESSYRILAG